MENEQHVREQVNEHITVIRNARIRESGLRASAYLYTTSGALVLSISFLTITGFSELKYPMLLASSWLFLLLAIITHLISYNFADRGFHKNEEDVRAWMKRGMPINDIPEDENIWTKLIRNTGTVSSVLTIIGLVLLVLFGSLNVLFMSDEEKKVIGTDSQESEQKHAEPTLSGPSLADRLSTSTPSEDKPSGDTDKSSNEKQKN
jgi:hypothetical protein